MAQAAVSRVRSKDGIEWHCETQGSGPDVVLIPSGDGDCGSFATIATSLTSSFTVTTFDMPGFSRSTASEEAMKDLTTSKLANQIIGLLDELRIDKATVYGCSSGGLIALTLAANHPGRVRMVVVHEVPLSAPPAIGCLKAMKDHEIVDACRGILGSSMCEDPDKLNALGAEYQARVEKNYIVWVRRYVCQIERPFSKDELTRRPVCWTIGALTPAGMFFQNVVDGYAAGIRVGLLPSKHFPQVTIPDVLAEHIREAVNKHL